MIDTTDWTPLYKIDYAHGHQVTTNMMYTPLVSPDGSKMCMVWDEKHPYQGESTKLTKAVIDFFFEREVKYLMECQQFAWAPRVLELDLSSRQVVIEWNTETLNHVLLTPGRNLDQECPNWQEQIFNILKELKDEGLYKMALYPHCFFITKDGIVKTFDFYACADIADPFIERSKVENIIGNDSGSRFNTATNNGVIDCRIFLKNTMLTHLAKTWPVNPFPEFYNTLFN